jgi:hypothetical protein
MTSAHLTEAETLDLAWGEALEASRLAHVAECSRCADCVAETRQGRALVEQDVVPDPDEVFWRAHLARTMARINEDVHARRLRAWVVWPLAFATTLALTTLMIMYPRPDHRPSPLAAWAPLPAVEDDLGYGLIAELVPAAEEAGVEGPAVTSWDGFDDLTADEQRSMLDALRTEMGRES